MRVELRPTIAADLPFCIDRPLPHRIKALTALVDGAVIAIGGIGYRPDGTVIAFMQGGEELRKYPRAVHRAGKLGMALIRRSGAPYVLAEAQDNNPAAERWLLHFGFEPTEFGGQRAFIWRRSPVDVE